MSTTYTKPHNNTQTYEAADFSPVCCLSKIRVRKGHLYGAGVEITALV